MDTSDQQIATAQGILEKLNNEVNKDMMKIGKYVTWASLYFYGNDINNPSKLAIDPRGTLEYEEFLTNSNYLKTNPMNIFLSVVEKTVIDENGNKKQSIVLSTVDFYNIWADLTVDIDIETGSLKDSNRAIQYSHYFYALKKFGKYKKFIKYMLSQGLLNSTITNNIHLIIGNLDRGVSGFEGKSKQLFNSLFTNDIGDGSNNTFPVIYSPDNFYGTTKLLEDYNNIKNKYASFVSEIVKMFKDCENLQICYANSSAGNIEVNDNLGSDVNLQLQAIAYCCEKTTKEETIEPESKDEKINKKEEKKGSDTPAYNNKQNNTNNNDDTKATKKIIMIIIVIIILVICFIIGGTLLTFFIIKNNKSTKTNNTV